MNITMIGSGNVATHLALALKGSGHVVSQVWSREQDHAEMLAYRVQAEAVSRLELIRPTADAYILAVSDDALFDLALDLRLGNALAVHTSGTTSMEVLRNVSSRYGVLWSPQTFVKDMAMDYAKLPLCIEGSSAAVADDIERLAASLSQSIYRIDGSQRQWLHLAAVWVNNFANALNASAQDMLAARDIPFELLFPLISLTARKAQYGNVWQQQTGPAVRGDSHTIAAQRRMLSDRPDLLELYDQMTSLIQHQAKSSGASHD